MGETGQESSVLANDPEITKLETRQADIDKALKMAQKVIEHVAPPKFQRAPKSKSIGKRAEAVEEHQVEDEQKSQQDEKETSQTSPKRKALSDTLTEIKMANSQAQNVISQLKKRI